MTGHPLDVDLADLVDGVLEAARATEVEAHLDECLLCRLKRRRLEGTPAPAPGGSPLPAPAFDVMAAENGVEPAVDDLWIAGTDDRLLVLVRSVAGDRVTAAPVTLDVGAADEETVIVEESPFRTAVAVHPALAMAVSYTHLTLPTTERV